MASINAENLLAPYLRRLNNQLRVDFAVDIHCTEGKRKREPTRSVYEEAVMKTKEKTTKGKTTKRRMKKTPSTAEAEKDNMEIMMNAAASLNQLRIRSTRAESPSVGAETTPIAEKTSIMKSHEEALASKDYIIKSITATLETKDELIRTQSMLISIMQKWGA